MNSLCILLPVLFPIAMALLALLFGKKMADQKFLRGFVSAVLVITAALTGLVLFRGGRAELQIAEDLSLLLKVDEVSRLFASLLSIMWLLAGIFSFEYMEEEEHQPSYYCFYMLVEGTLLALAFAGNYLTMYMAFEFMSILSFPMILHSRTREAIMGALKYLFYSIFGATVGLLGFFYITYYAKTSEFAYGGILDASKIAGHEGAILVVVFLTILGFGTKAGMFPMHAWLPSAHPVAPGPASAVMSGVITKCGVVAVVRVVFFAVGADFIRGTWVHWTWMILTLITVFMGSMLAYKEKIFKKRLAYSSVSQVSYILFGLSTLNPLGFVGAWMHVIFHSTIKDLLFLCAGAVIHMTGCKDVDGLKGMGKRMPVTMWCFTIASLGLIGIPPTCGFVSKWYLASGSLNSGMGVLTWVGPVVLLVSAFLTAGYLLTISIRAFLPGADFDYQNLKVCDPGPLMCVPMLILAAAVVLLGIFAGPLKDWLLIAAEQIL